MTPGDAVPSNVALSRRFAMPKVGDVVGRFVLQGELGRGPRSEVFLALEEATRWKVALKVFVIERGALPDDHRAWAQRMVREARAAAAFRHDSAVRVHEVGEAAGVPYLVRDFIEGRSLAEVVADRSTTLEWKVYWLRELARTLADIHRAGLVHRDVKPTNVLVRRDGALRVLDFGVARRSIGRDAGVSGPASDRLAGGPSARTLGTAAYTAPERFANQPSAPATDQFSWGVLAHELLTGALPWDLGRGAPGDGPVEPVKVIEAILTQSPPSARISTPDLPPALDAVLTRTMAKTAGLRFASMDDVVRAFDAAVR